MSFDLMRRHRRKVEVPLAIFVVVTFVLFFGISGIDKVLAEWRQSKTDMSASETQLFKDAQDLISAGMMDPPPTDFRQEDRAKQEKMERAAYVDQARYSHQTPAILAEELGLRVGAADLSEELTKRMKDRPWNLEPMKPDESPAQYEARYHKLLSNRGLTGPRFTRLLREDMAIERLQHLLASAGAASEAEMYGVYAQSRQRVRVQYLQRRTADFVKTVEEVSAKEAKETAGVEAPAKATEGGKDSKPERKGVSEADLRKQYDDMVARLKTREPREGQPWNSQLVAAFPDYFSEERAQVEYLVATRDGFVKRVTVKPEEVDKHYKDNPTKYFEEAKPKDTKDAKDGEAAKPKRRPLDDKLREEIRKELLEERAAAAAEEALKAAVKEYNEADPEKRPALRDLAAKHNLEKPRMSIEAGREELEEQPYFKGASGLLWQVFNEKTRNRNPGALFGPEGTKADEKDDAENAWVAVRVAKFEASRLLTYEQAKAALRTRAVLEKAVELAKQAAADDRKLLLEGKLDPALVRTSVLLGPGDETTRQAAALAIGEASSEPYEYWQLLGPDEEAEKARQKKKDEERKAGKRAKEKPDVADDYARGYRVIVVVERTVPTYDEFRKDQAWREAWFRDMPRMRGIPEQYLRQMLPNYPGYLWRSFYQRTWLNERYNRAVTSPE
ncbi:MAG TPA: hypothetical protein PK280_12695 [Planctomycetota bacterium]|nr:hypothetical protein [Planctomycetota bacterium]